MLHSYETNDGKKFAVDPALVAYVEPRGDGYMIGIKEGAGKIKEVFVELKAQEVEKLISATS